MPLHLKSIPIIPELLHLVAMMQVWAGLLPCLVDIRHDLLCAKSVSQHRHNISHHMSPFLHRRSSVPPRSFLFGPRRGSVRAGVGRAGRESVRRRADRGYQRGQRLEVLRSVQVNCNFLWLCCIRPSLRSPFLSDHLTLHDLYAVCINRRMHATV